MKAYKFLATGGVGRFSDFPWPTPDGDLPGEWVESAEPLPDCLTGIHACRLGDLLDWIDDELWEIELDGMILERESMVVAERGRLLRRIETWNEQTAQDFADACAWRSRTHTLTALRRAGVTDGAQRLAEATDLEEMQLAAVEFTADGNDPIAREVAAFSADVVSIAGGNRPESWAAIDPPPPGSQTAATNAANVGFVAAHAAGRVAETPEGYPAAFASEQAWQTNWLIEHLRLEPVGSR
jgi:hypothetical protein